jgi:succinoglycan biosynthesis transport protein ExoP
LYRQSTPLSVHMDNDVQEDHELTYESSHLIDYWLTIRRRLWLILGLVLIVAVGAFMHSSQMTPKYRATAKVLIERYNPQVIKVDEVLPDDVWANDYYPTQYEILKSASLAQDVIKVLHLDRHPEFNPEPEKRGLPISIRSALASVVRKVVQREKKDVNEPSSRNNSDPLGTYVKIYLSRLDISPIRSSRLVNISFEGGDPELVAKVANEHAEAYIQKNMDMKLSATQEAVGWLGGRLAELRQSLQESREKLQRFVEREDIVTLENVLSASGGNEENILTQKVAQLNSSLSHARTERMGLETRYEQIQKASGSPKLVDSTPDVIQSPVVQSIRRELIALNRQYAENLHKFGEKHPHMLALREEINSLQSRLNVEIDRIFDSVRMQYEMAMAKEQSLEQAMQQAKSEVNELNRKAIQYGMLKQEIESNREIYEMILKRAKETSLTSALKSTNVFIVDRAEVPQAPFEPKVQRSVLIASIIALMLGIGLAFLLDYLDQTFHGPDEVERTLGVSYLGSVGLVTPDIAGSVSELVVLKEPASGVVESLRAVRTNMLFSLAEPGPKTLLVTSPGPLEGKTFLSANLAVAMTELGRRVLLIDADLRKPRLHKIFGKPSTPGLSDLILGQCTLCDAVKDTQVKGLKLLPAGKIPRNASGTLGSGGMREFIAQLKGRFDFIIFDTPPVLTVTDAAVLTGNLDGIIFVLKAGETTRSNAKRAFKQLQNIESKVLGVVLNQVDFRRERYYYTYGAPYYYSEERRKGLPNASEVDSIAGRG